MKRQLLTNVRVVLGLLVASALVVSTIAPAAQAQTSTNATDSSANVLKVSPVRSDVTIEAGKSAEVPVTITNLTNGDVKVTAIENDFVQGDENGTPSIILDQNTFAPTHSLKKFMLPVADVTIPANESVVVKLTISVPSDAQAGGYFGALRFVPTTDASGGQVNLNASVASLVLLTVPGPVTEILNLTDFSIEQGTAAGTNFRDANDLKAAFRFENKGNIQLAPFGQLSVTKGKETVFTYDFNQDAPRDVVLPDGARKWEVALDGIDGFGYYTVHALFSYGSENKSIEVEKSFWIIPTVFIIAAIAILVLIIGGIIFLVFWLRGRHKRAIRRHAGRRR